MVGKSSAFDHMILVEVAIRRWVRSSLKDKHGLQQFSGCDVAHMVLGLGPKWAKKISLQHH